jgi:hypothetical protein
MQQFNGHFACSFLLSAFCFFRFTSPMPEKSNTSGTRLLTPLPVSASALLFLNPLSAAESPIITNASPTRTKDNVEFSQVT